ncbi:hypothetical protein [Litorimonas sp. WD9-15]|uniref:hypothetical protein n=1 Tax=Litorimonas sp. WD9-15 TaxID=3418716 RepID=UPI003D01A2FF
MAYRIETLENFSSFDLEWVPDMLEMPDEFEVDFTFEPPVFTLNPVSIYSSLIFSPFDGAILPPGYSYVGDEIMDNLYGADSAWADYDPDNFNFGNASNFMAIPGLTAPMSNLFGSTISVSTGGNSDLDQYVQQVTDLAQAALNNIAQYIQAAAGASLDVAITLAQQGPSTVASAGAGALYFSGETINGFSEIVTASQLEFVTGNDPNGAGADIVVTVNTDFLTSASAFLETGANRMPGANQIDYVSVLTHEIMHGLGFFSFRDNSGNASNPSNPPNIESTYGVNVDFGVEGFGTLVPRYSGDNVLDVYGEDVLAEYLFNSAGSDVSHFGRFDAFGQETDLRFALMNPSVVLGDVTTIGAIELAVFRDLGYDVQNDATVELVNRRDSLANNVTLDVAADLSTTFSSTGLFVSRSATNTGQGLVSLGVSATLADGTVQSGRVRLTDAEPFALFTFLDDFLFAIGEAGGGDIDMRAFYGANAALTSGQIEENFTVTFETQPATTGNDVINGTADSDRLVGGAGNDELRTFDSDDVALGGRGSDFIVLGLGDDHAYGGTGNDTIRGDEGFDRLYGNGGRDTLRGGDGVDSIFGGADRDTIFGDLDDDYIEGGAGNDRIFGGEGSDTILGGDGVDNIDGDAGGDTIFGGAQGDTIRGEGGDDIINGEAGLDRLFGGEGTDTITGGDGDDRIFGGDDGDFLFGEADDDLIYGELGNDEITGGAGRDRLFGGEGNDTINGGDDNDRVIGNEGEDILNGDAGNDTLGGGIDNDELFGGTGDDTLLGGDGSDILLGGADDDRLFGGEGPDILDGGTGNDRLNGGTGGDLFVFGVGYGVDIIQDFEDGIDELQATGYTTAEIQTAIDNAFMASIYLILDFGNGDQLRIANVMDGDITIDDFVA